MIHYYRCRHGGDCLADNKRRIQEFELNGAVTLTVTCVPVAVEAVTVGVIVTVPPEMPNCVRTLVQPSWPRRWSAPGSLPRMRPDRPPMSNAP